MLGSVTHLVRLNLRRDREQRELKAVFYNFELEFQICTKFAWNFSTHVLLLMSTTHKACHCQIKMTCQISQFRTLPAMDMYMRPYLVSIAVGHCHEWHCQQWLQIFNNAASLSLPNSCCVVTMECYGRGNNHCPIVAMSVPWPLLDSCHVSTMDIENLP